MGQAQCWAKLYSLNFGIVDEKKQTLHFKDVFKIKLREKDNKFPHMNFISLFLELEISRLFIFVVILTLFYSEIGWYCLIALPIVLTLLDFS